ncbi:hypothetical protein [Flavobacterium psychrotrophum]|uniref:hypothetical protein n=1 Tax=Flavobacterium psychrotrophum TaxID=2294119 RepID=UPI000E31D569|nr:hypothetical protein [Flavobacterium psychrotrophum]
MKAKRQLTNEEFAAICEYIEGTVIDYTSESWIQSLILTFQHDERFSELCIAYNIDITNLAITLGLHSERRFLELMVNVDERCNRDKTFYENLGLISANDKLIEFTSNYQKHKPIIWKEENGSLYDFLRVCNGLDFDYVIYVRDVNNENLSIWGTFEEDLIDCFTTFSESHYFGRIQPIHESIIYGFTGLS